MEVLFKHISKILLCYFLCLVTLQLKSQDITGKWKTIDDNTGKTKSVVEIFENQGKYYGKVVKLFKRLEENQDPVCDECKGDLKNEKIIGLQIINDMVLNKKSQEYVDGSILDPENGKVYDCKIWLDEDKLMVRGYVMFLYRTQTWLPYSE